MNQKRQGILVIWGIVLGVMCISPKAGQASWCEVFAVTVSEEEIECYQKVEGYYYNCSLGYAVTIPEGFIGRHESSPSGPEYGFGMVLSRQPLGYIWVHGDVTLEDVESPTQMASKYINWIKNDGHNILTVREFPVTLHRFPALRQIVRYNCPEKIMVLDRFITIPPHSGITYTINLMADEIIYDQSKPILERLTATWRLRQFDCEPVCSNDPPLTTPEYPASNRFFDLHTDDYENCVFGYAVSIPDGLIGYSNRSSSPSYGLGIYPIHQGYLSVEGDVNTLRWESLEQAADEYIEWITAETQEIRSVQKLSVTLGELPGVRLRVRYTCADGVSMIKDLWLAMDAQREVVYKLVLIVEETKYDEYKPILEQLAETFRLTEESCK